MAIQGLPFAPSPAYSPMPDFVSALTKGIEGGFRPRTLSEELLHKQLENKLKNIELQYAPQKIAMGLRGSGLAQTLTNLKIQELLNAQKQEQAFNQLLSGENFGSQNNTQSTSNYPEGYEDNNFSMEGPGPAKSNSAYDTFPGRRPSNYIDKISQKINASQGQEEEEEEEQQGFVPAQQNAATIASPGNPNLYRIDEIYDKYPQFRERLKKKGFEKKQEVKFDPRTGSLTTITTYPSGKTEVSHSKNENDEFSTPTQAIRTSQQKTINSIRNATPIIEKIINETKKGQIPGQLIGKYFSPNKEAEYLSDVVQSADTLAGALGYPATDKGLEAAKLTVMRQPLETDKGYVKRLKVLLKDLSEREKTAKEALSKGISKKTEPAKAITLQKRKFNNAEEFKSYLQSLTPEQRLEARRLYLGEG